jgi:hypothetical protein
VEYQLTAEVNPPADATALDALQRHGVAALLGEHLELLAEIEGPDGVEVEPLDHRITVHPTGASIAWTLEAPALAFAEDAARTVLDELLERTDLLAEWSVRRCEVTASDEDLAAALEGSDDEGDEGDEDGSADADVEIDLDELSAIAGVGVVTEADREAQREQLLDAAEGLGAFGLESFGYDAEDAEGEIDIDSATLVAGALIQGLEVLTEELFADIQTLDEAGTPASEQEVLWVLHDLPSRFAGHYTALFAKKFLVNTAILGYRLAQPEWDGPLNLAEALAIRLLKSAAENQLELAGLLEELPLEQMFDIFDEHAFADIDVEALYEDADADIDNGEDDEDEADEMVLVDWFEVLEDAEAEADDESEADATEADDEDTDEDEDEDAEAVSDADQHVQA